ncbi:M28 family peptidase [Pseudomonas aeruginosa]
MAIQAHLDHVYREQGAGDLGQGVAAVGIETV